MSHTNTSRGIGQFDHLPAAEAARRAWTNAGPVPAYHRKIVGRIRKEAPVLARALDRLASTGALDGQYGERTIERLHLYGTSEDYRTGYWAGKATLHRPMREGAALIAQLRGGAYLDGFKTGRKVRRHGIKPTLGHEAK